MAHYDKDSQTYYTVSSFQAGDSTPSHPTSPVEGQTLARDRSIIPLGGVRVDLDGYGDGWLANDVGGENYIYDWRLDLFEGVDSNCKAIGFTNPIVVGSCNVATAPNCPPRLPQPALLPQPAAVSRSGDR